MPMVIVMRRAEKASSSFSPGVRNFAPRQYPLAMASNISMRE